MGFFFIASVYKHTICNFKQLILIVHDIKFLTSRLGTIYNLGQLHLQRLVGTKFGCFALVVLMVSSNSC